MPAHSTAQNPSRLVAQAGILLNPMELFAAMRVSEKQLEDELIDKLEALKYVYRPDIQDRASLEQNFREKFEALNRVKLTDAEFQRLLDEIETCPRKS